MARRHVADHAAVREIAGAEVLVGAAKKAGERLVRVEGEAGDLLLERLLRGGAGVGDDARQHRRTLLLPHEAGGAEERHAANGCHRNLMGGAAPRGKGGVAQPNIVRNRAAIPGMRGGRLDPTMLPVRAETITW